MRIETGGVPNPAKEPTWLQYLPHYISESPAQRGMVAAVPKTQTAYGYVHGKKEIQRFENVPVPLPTGSEVLLKIEAAGLCRSDFHILLAQEEHVPKKFVMGHEICGQIVAVGPDLSDGKFAVGSRYCMMIADACGRCTLCRKGSDNQCLQNNGAAYGLNQDGGFQEYLLVKNLRSLVPIVDGVSYEEAALATDAILTPFHAIMKVRGVLGPAAKVLVIGAGGLGLNAIQILSVFGCEIVCVDRKADNGPVTKELGAAEFYSDPLAIKHRPESFDVCFDLVGNQHTVDACVRFVKHGGKIVMVGLGKLKVVIPNYDLARREVDVKFNFGGTSSEQAEILEWIRAKRIRPVYTQVGLSELPTYIMKLAKGEVLGRIVFKPKL